MSSKKEEKKINEIFRDPPLALAKPTNPPAVTLGQRRNLPAVTEEQQPAAEAITLEKYALAVTLFGTFKDLTRGDKILARRVIRKLLDLKTWKETRAEAAATERREIELSFPAAREPFDGYKSTSDALKWYGLKTSPKAAAVALVAVGILKVGKDGGYIVNSKLYGTTERLRSSPRPRFTGTGARDAFRTIGLLRKEGY